MQVWLNVVVSLVLLLATYSVNGLKGLNDPCVADHQNQVPCMINKLDEKLSSKLDKVIQLIQSKPCSKPGQTSCKEIFDKGECENKAYTLNVDSKKIPVYCHMTPSGLGSCGGGGWTLVMKTDGAKKTFHYDSKLWTNKDDFNLSGGKTLLDRHETKLPTYWSTPFSKICLVMKIDNQVNSIVIDTHAKSLYSLIADGKYRSTSLDRKTWKKLIGQQASLQKNCNREGFNVVPAGSSHCRTRIGIASNDQNECKSPDSRIGFGGGGHPDDHNTCGNVAKYSPDGENNIKAMGYILVQ